MTQHANGRQSMLGWIEARINLTEIASFLSVFGLLPAELDTRKPLRQAIDEAMHRPLPSFARWPRVLGILSFLLFLFLGLTGLMLAFYYQPTATEAYGSVTTIVRDVTFGSLVHQVHRWSAILFLAILGARVIRFYFGGLYGRGREVVWMVAVTTFVVATFADLTGRLLPWDAGGYWTTVRAKEVTDALPGVGAVFNFFVGGNALDSLVLTRFYVLHLALFPLLILLLFYLHFSSVRRVGLSAAGPTPEDAAPADASPGGRSLRVAIHNVLLIVVFMVGTLITLAVLVPHAFDPPADPFVTPSGVLPPWYLLAPHAVLESLPAFVPPALRGLFLLALLAGVLFLPFLDRRVLLARPQLRLILGVVACLLWLALAIQGWHLEVNR
jgi:quinol-cytochrome oxidoreductase complex cytochrome b subunit